MNEIVTKIYETYFINEYNYCLSPNDEDPYLSKCSLWGIFLSHFLEKLNHYTNIIFILIYLSCLSVAFILYVISWLSLPYMVYNHILRKNRHIISITLATKNFIQILSIIIFWLIIVTFSDIILKLFTQGLQQFEFSQ